MTISWANSDGKSGIVENEYEFAMQHQEKTPEPEQTPFDQAHEEMNLNQQEKDLYQRHLGNLYGTGGVDNPDGSRSSLYNLGVEHEGRTYNVPSVYEGKILLPREAVDKAFNEGINRFPSYPTREEAEQRYSRMHDFMEMDTKNYQDQRSKMSPQERINESFSQIPKKRYDDQNNPAVWGLGEVNQSIDSMMQDQGPKQRQENIQQELDSGQQRTPLEHQIQARRSGAADSEGVSTYDVPGSDRESRMYLNDMYSKFKKQPLEGPHKNLTEQEYKDLLWDTPITSSKGGGPSAADIQEMLDVTDEEHKANYDEAVKLLGKDNVIGGILPSGRIRMRKDSEGYQEYIKNIPDDVSVHDMGDGSVILRKKPGGKPPVVGSLQDELGDPSQIPTSTYQQFADYVHDLRVKFTGEPDKWSGKEVVGDFLDKAMSVMGAGYRIPKVPIRTGIPERITSPAVKSGNKVFEGENHGIAYEKADSPESYVDGYVTNKGRFVTREEAAGIAKGQEQVLMEARQTEELHSGELKPGYERTPASTTRLYRAETSTLPGEKPGPVSDWIAESPEYKSMLEATGRWFTNSRESAQWYMDKMGGKRISYVDIPSKDLESYNVANNPEARKFTAAGRANEEFFLPSEIAATRKSLAAQEAFDAKVAAGKKIGAADYPHVQEAFLKEIEAGNIKVSDLAEKLKLSDDQVRAVAKATNTDLNALRYSTWNEKNIQQLKDMIAEGKTYTEIAKELGVTRSAVGGKVARLGLELRHDLSTTGLDKRAHPNLGKIYDDELRSKIRTMFAKGRTSKEIAEELNLNPSTLRYQTSIHQLRK